MAVREDSRAPSSCPRTGSRRRAAGGEGPRRPLPGTGGSGAGFSLVEILVAMLLMALGALSILPLFMHSVANNNRGAEATQASNLARSRLETLLQTPFDAGPLVVPAGAEEASSTESLTTGQGARWTLTTRVRQFSLRDLAPDGEGVTELSMPLAGTFSGIAPGSHLKEIEVEVRTAREAGPLGAGQVLIVRAYKAK